jgi:hypothetical protein
MAFYLLFSSVRGVRVRVAALGETEYGYLHYNVVRIMLIFTFVFYFPMIAV